MILYIKHMVSHRCKMFMEDVLHKVGIHCVSIKLGKIQTVENIRPEQYEQIRLSLLDSGLELIVDQKDILIEQIKTIIIESVHYSDEIPKTNFSDYLSIKLKRNYTYLSNLFSISEGMTIQHFIALHKIEKIKELITYNELSIKEIAFKLNYSSAAHLSNQFKKETGITISLFRSQKEKKLTSIDKL